MPTTDLAHVDTTPGSGHLFAPPAEFAGDADAYARWLHECYSLVDGFSPVMLVLSRYVCGRSQYLSPTITGPYATRLIHACKALDDWAHQPQAASA